jgi:hypothetical protein
VRSRIVLGIQIRRFFDFDLNRSSGRVVGACCLLKQDDMWKEHGRGLSFDDVSLSVARKPSATPNIRLWRMLGSSRVDIFRRIYMEKWVKLCYLELPSFELWKLSQFTTQVRYESRASLVITMRTRSTENPAPSSAGSNI